MIETSYIEGFSKLDFAGKISKISSFFPNPSQIQQRLSLYLNTDEILQEKHLSFAENTLSNYYLPFCVAPNFLINGQYYIVPLVTEESSVVAALSKSASIWAKKGGFKCTTLGKIKKGQIHFKFSGNKKLLIDFFEKNKHKLLLSCATLNENMVKRGARGLIDIKLLDKTDKLPHYFQIDADFDTSDAMGANFINSNLEKIASVFQTLFENSDLKIIMSILSNYTPDSLYRAELRCKVDEIGASFAEKFVDALNIASVDVSRAVTHNKGIMNGVDALVIATGNDFRAVEASCHSFAAKQGEYKSLSKAQIKDGEFIFWVDLPLSLGTVGGLTKLHSLASFSLELLGNPCAEKLCQITTAIGLAQNYAAVSSLITTGIQKGHMKMHLTNILRSFNASHKHITEAERYFRDKEISVKAVEELLKKLN